MILTRLKHETYVEHQALEARIDLFSHLGSPAVYRRLIERFWGFYAPIEALLRTGPEWVSYGVDLQQRMKAPALALDLHALGLALVAIDALPHCCALPPLESFSQRLGCLYVLEGATLGGQIIAREVRTRLGLTPDNGCAFFTSYGDQIGLMWRAFRTLLLQVAVDEPTEAAIVGGAHETFAAFDRWLALGAKADDHDG